MNKESITLHDRSDSKPNIAVIIISWNVKEYVKRCLQSIREHLCGLCYEVILVDNASCDQTVEYVRKNFSEVRIIQNSQNLGFAAANNIAVKATDAEILVFANPDTELTCHINPLMKPLKENNVAVVFGRLRYPDGATQNFIRNFPTPLNMFGELFGLPNILPKWTFLCELVREKNHRIYDKSRFIDAASGAFFLMKRDVYAEMGMFDEAFFVYSEETDLFFRLKKKGYMIYYEPNCTILHHHGKSTSGNPAMYAMLQQNRYKFVKKHYSGLFAFSYRYLFLLFFDIMRFFYAKLYSVFMGEEERQKRQKIANKHKEGIFWELFGKA